MLLGNIRPFLCTLALTAAGVALSPAAQANNDAEAELLVDSVFESEYLDAKFGESLEKLQLANEACEGGSCSDRVRAKILVAIGVVLAGGLKNVDDAAGVFELALTTDPKAKLPKDFVTPEVEEAFEQAKKKAGVGGGSDEPVEKPRKVFSGDGPKPKGWDSAEAYFYYSEALNSEKERDWRVCYLYTTDSLKVEDRLQTKFVGARCAEKAGLWLEAEENYADVAKKGSKVGLFEQAKDSREASKSLRERIPKLVLRPPADVDDLVVKVANKTIPKSKLGGEIWVNPGQTRIVANGRSGDVAVAFEQIVDLAEFETATIDLELVPRDQALQDRLIMKCLAESKSKEEFANCIETGGSGINAMIGTEFSVYHDSDNVDVISPAFFTTISSPTSGWTVGGGFLVDLVTAASSDIVATASPGYQEYRYVPTIHGSQKFGDVTIGLSGNLSIEPDYLATGVGANISADIIDKRVTPTLGYEFSYDISGRAGTSFDTFGNEIFRHGVTAAVSVVLDKATIGGFSFTGVFEDGDTSKPYRYVPVFSPDIVDSVPAGLAPDAVNQFREPERIAEQLPIERQRYAVAVSFAHRFTDSTLRADERIYTDSWGVKASSTNGRYIIDVGERYRIWPAGRLHVQTGADFWRLAYPALRTSNGLSVPALRTGDRELGPLFSITGGAGARADLGEEKNWGVQLEGSLVYTRFLDTLYILQRIGYFGALTLEAEFE